MNRLPERFRSDGFDFRVLKRVDNVALLEKIKHSGAASYEVVIIQSRPAETIYGLSYPAREVMPMSEAWGVLGWSYCDRVAAEAKLASVVLANRRESAISRSKGSSRHGERPAEGDESTARRTEVQSRHSTKAPRRSIGATC